MDIYKRASKKKLRFSGSKGNLSVEQLWGLSVTELDAMAVAQNEKVEKSSGKSFIQQRNPEDADEKLKFDILFDVLQSKLADQERALKAAETKQRNQKIMSLISEKKDEELKGKSVEELEKLIQ